MAGVALLNIHGDLELSRHVITRFRTEQSECDGENVGVDE